MVHYIGLDVSLKRTSICVVNQVGSVVREGVVDSDPEAIATFVRSKAPGAVRMHSFPAIRSDRCRAACVELYYRRAACDGGGRGNLRSAGVDCQSIPTRPR
jgi:hypothetical protein